MLFRSIYQSAVKNVRKNAFLYSAMMSNGRIENRRPGGESTHNFASFLYKLLCSVINCQTLNSPGSFDGVCQEIYGYSIWHSAGAKVALT